MATTAEPAFVPGIWGPYFSAMVPGAWLNEGGQSTSGAAIDHLVQSPRAWGRASAEAKTAGLGTLDYLEGRIAARVSDLADSALLSRSLHVLPDFLGNRSPFADPGVRGVVAGISLDDSIEDLERTFVAGLSGIAYGLGEVIDALRAKGILCET